MKGFVNEIQAEIEKRKTSFAWSFLDLCASSRDSKRSSENKKGMKRRDGAEWQVQSN